MQNFLPYNERELLLLLSGGDETAFGTIYNEYQSRLYLYIYPFTRNSKEETEEVIQDVFVKLWMRKEALPAIENFPKYLFRMARNQFLDMQKKKIGYQTAIKAQRHNQSEFRSPIYENIIFNEYTAVAKSAIDSLSPQRKRIFIMRYENDMSFDEIAGSLNIAKTTVKRQLYEAVTIVKDYLLKHGELPALLFMIVLTYIPF